MFLSDFLVRLYQKLPLVREVRQIRDAVWKLEASLKAPDLVRMLDFELVAHPRYGDPKRLFLAACQVCSQNGEDGVIREIFRRVGTSNRVCVEIGVGEGTENNTAFLISQGWRGFWFDGNDQFLKTIERREDVKKLVRGCQALVTKENVADLLDRSGVPVEFDLLSIDVDQNTYHIWDGLGRFRPRVVVVEYNASLPPDLEWVVHYSPKRVWDGSVNFGASLKALEMLGQRKGYVLVSCDFTGVNAFFVRSDLVREGRFCAPYTAENHYEPPRYRAAIRRGHPPAILDPIPAEARS